MRKKQINKKLRLFSIITLIIIIAIISFLLINGLINPKIKEESISLYDYTINPNVDYEVQVKPNLLYGEKTLPEGETYFTEFLGTIDAKFSYEFNGEREADIKGSYEIVAIAEGYSKENEETKTIWKKKFPIKSNKTFNEKSSNILIDENIEFDLNEYNEFAKSVSEASKTIVASKVSLIMNVNLEATTDKGAIEKSASPTIVIPLEQPSFIIEKIGVEEQSSKLEGTKKVEVPLDKKLIIIYSLLIGISLIVLIYLILFTKNIIENNKHKKHIDKIFKNHGSRLVALEKDIDFTYENNYRVRSIDDLVRVADEIEKPIMYKYSSNYEDIKEFYVVDDNSLYTFNLQYYIKNTERDQKDIKKKLIKSENA